MEHDVILARYGEIGLKSTRVRRRFESLLKDNIEYAFERESLDVVVKRIPGRFVVSTSDIARGLEILVRIFGLTSVSPVRRVPSDLESILGACVAYARQWRREHPEATTFAVRSRRSGSHPFTSQELAAKAGSAVLTDAEAGAGLRVDLGAAEFELFLDVRGKDAYLHADVLDGPGGLPLGTAGRVVALLKDQNSVVAAWLMMKRGCTVLPVHFEGPTGRPDRAAEFEALLKRWYLRGNLHAIDHSEAATYPADATCAVCVRQMVRKAAAYAKRRRAKTLVTGEVLASTTVPFMAAASEVTDVSVLRPLMGLMPQMVAKTADRIGLATSPAAEHREPCPLRRQGPTPPARVAEIESQLGLAQPSSHAERPA